MTRVLQIYQTYGICVAELGSESPEIAQLLQCSLNTAVGEASPCGAASCEAVPILGHSIRQTSQITPKYRVDQRNGKTWKAGHTTSCIRQILDVVDLGMSNTVRPIDFIEQGAKA